MTTEPGNANTPASAKKAAQPATPSRAVPKSTDPKPPKAKATGDDAPLYRVNAKSFVGHAQFEEGDEITYELDKPDSEIGDNLSPLNAAAQAVVDAQAGPHPDKSTGKKARGTRAAADAASADLGSVDDEAGDDDLG